MSDRGVMGLYMALRSEYSDYTGKLVLFNYFTLRMDAPIITDTIASQVSVAHCISRQRRKPFTRNMYHITREKKISTG